MVFVIIINLLMLSSMRVLKVVCLFSVLGLMMVKNVKSAVLSVWLLTEWLRISVIL